MKSQTSPKPIRKGVRASTYALSYALTALALVGTAYAACPDYTHKDVILGESKTLPQGFLLYALTRGKGVHKSPLDRYAPQIVPNTQTDEAMNIAIGDDGDWFLYTALDKKRMFVMRTDGSGKTQVPAQGVIAGVKEMVSGIVRRGPFGLEIHYKTDDKKIRAIGLKWEGGKPVFGRDRLVGSFGYMVRTAAGISGNRIFTEIEGLKFITVPDGGKGTAGDGDFWKYSGKAENGCFATLSFDGMLTAGNPGFYGDPACVPQEAGNNWHKGFVVTPFMEKGAASMSMGDLMMKQSKSINWCPPKYRFGAVWEVDFSGWNFTNRNEYIVGVQRGEKTPVFGAWLVHWSTNTWTMLTGTSVKASNTAVHISGHSAALLSRSGALVASSQQAPISAIAFSRTDLLGRIRLAGRLYRGGYGRGTPVFPLAPRDD